MNPRILDPVASLRRTPDNLDAALRGRPESWLDSRHVDDVLSPREVVGHFIQGEKEDWIPRIEIVLEYGESRAFTPFEVYAAQAESHHVSVEEMLTQFRTLRIKNLAKLTELDLNDDQLDTRGTHPAHGAVTLEELIHTWAAHDLYHLGQIFKSFSMNFVGKIGVWQETLNLPHFN